MAGRTAAEMSRQVALTAVQQNGLALEHAAASHRSDRELVLSAVQQNGLALKYASKAMRMDHDIVLAATKQNGAALQFAAGEFKCAPAHPVQRVLAAALHHTQAELIQWRSGQIKLVADMIDVDGNSLAPAVVRSRGDPPVRGSKRHIEPTDTASRLKKVKLELKESVHRYGELVGQGQEFSKAHGTVFSKLRECFPPGADSPVTWRALGEIDLGKLMELGLRQEDVGAATAWQQGFWLLSPPAEEEAAAGDGWPPFIASWAFKKHVTVGPDGRQEITYSIREQTEVLRVERLMPPQYEGPPRYNEFKMSAAFVQHLRRRYSRTKADRILAYLLEKYEEYERHSGGVGFSGYSVIHKAWNEAENREMSFSEMLALLTTFISEPAVAAAAAAEAAVETPAAEATGGESEPPSAESASPSASADQAAVSAISSPPLQEMRQEEGDVEDGVERGEMDLGQSGAAAAARALEPQATLALAQMASPAGAKAGAEVHTWIASREAVLKRLPANVVLQLLSRLGDIVRAPDFDLSQDASARRRVRNALVRAPQPERDWSTSFSLKGDVTTGYKLWRDAVRLINRGVATQAPGHVETIDHWSKIRERVGGSEPCFWLKRSLDDLLRMRIDWACRLARALRAWSEQSGNLRQPRLARSIECDVCGAAHTVALNSTRPGCKAVAEGAGAAGAETLLGFATSFAAAMPQPTTPAPSLVLSPPPQMALRLMPPPLPITTAQPMPTAQPMQPMPTAATAIPWPPQPLLSVRNDDRGGSSSGAAALAV